MRPHNAARRAALSALVAAALGAVATAPASATTDDAMPDWTLAALPDDAVPFQGIASTDAAGASGAMLYPAPNLVVALAALATHAAIIGISSSSQKSELQLQADKVLDPYRESLAGFHLHELQQRALGLSHAAASAHLRGADQAPASDWVVQGVPVFSMTADGSALVLDDAMSVRQANVSKPVFEQTVRIVNAPRGGDVAAQWNADGGAALKSAAAGMMAQAIDIALAQARHPVDDSAPAFRTVRYVQGGTPRTERAQVVDESCERMVIRTLRGAMMSVPHRVDAVLPAGCPAPAPVAPVIAPAAPASAPAGTPAEQSAAVAPAIGASSAS